MAKYVDMLMGDSYDPNAAAPATAAPAPRTKSYYDMLSGGAEIKPAAPEFMSSPTANVSPTNDSSKMAGMGTQAIASLPADIKERAGYFAKQRFPNDPNAIGKYGIQDGRIFYQGDDGQMYFEEPKLSTSPTELAKYAASSAGPALPVAGSIIGGVASSVAGGVPGAAIGAAAGDEIRQGLAMGMAGQENFSPMQTGGEAALGGFGQGIGAATVKFSNRNAARDIAKAMTPEVQARIHYLDAAAKEFGLTLTPAEKTGLPSLASQQNVLSSLPTSADIMAENLYTPRNTQQIPGAFDEFASRISPVESVEVGAKNLQQGAEATIKSQVAERQAVASPLYKEVYPKKIPPNTFLSIVKQNDIIWNAVKGAENDEVTRYYIQKYEQETGQKITANSVGFLDAVKQSIDDKAAAALRSGETKRAAAYTDSAAMLRNKIDSTVPKYAEARAAYAGESPAVDALKQGEVGLVAGKTPTQMDTAPRTMFDTGPMAIKRNRAAYLKAGKEQEWNDGLRSYLTEKFTAATKEFKSGNTNPGGSFRASVFGTGKQKEAMREAMTPENFAGFSRLMDVLEASGKVPQGGSRTAFAGEAIQDMKKQSGGIVSKALRVASPSNLLDTTRIAKAYEQMRMGNYAENLAEIITSPDGMKNLRALKALPPNSVKARSIVSQLLLQYGIAEASDDGPVPLGGLSDKNANQQITR